MLAAVFVITILVFSIRIGPPLESNINTLRQNITDTVAVLSPSNSTFNGTYDYRLCVLSAGTTSNVTIIKPYDNAIFTAVNSTVNDLKIFFLLFRLIYYLFHVQCFLFKRFNLNCHNKISLFL